MAKENHKGMQASKDDALIHRYFRMFNLHPAENIDFSTQGGFVYNGSESPVGYIRSPFWRPEKGAEYLGRSDYRKIYLKERSSTAYSEIESGGELEIYGWDPEKEDITGLMGPESQIPQRLEAINNSVGFVEEDKLYQEFLSSHVQVVGFSAELATAMMELNFHHAPDPKETALATFRSLKHLVKETESENKYVLPIACLPNRRLTPKDVNPDAYVQRIANEYMKPENVLHFTGAAFQVHVEMIDPISAIKAINAYQLVSPLTYGMTLSGPFAYGEVKPNLYKHFISDEPSQARASDTETYQQLNRNGTFSSRYASRWRGSPSGGVFEEPLPEDINQVIKQAERGLNDDSSESIYNIPSPARVAGHHRDRLRIDIPPYGTIELCNFDNDGAHPHRMTALQEFHRAMGYKLQMYFRQGRQQELFDAYPELFGSVNKDSLRQAHFNSLTIGADSLSATIIGQDGNQYVAADLARTLIDFVATPANFGNEHFDGLPKKITSLVRLATETPDKTDFAKNQVDGLTSSRGFYTTAKGTLSHWLKKRAEELQARGYTEEEVIKNCMTDLATSFHQFIHDTNPNTIISLFE